MNVSDRANAEQNVDGGVRYVAQLLKRYNGDINNTLMAYNWGMGNVDAYLKTGKGANGQPIPKETTDYLRKIKGAVNAFSTGQQATNKPVQNLNKTNKNVVYANQDAKRNQPLKLGLVNIMSSVMKPLGVTMKVHSGGQSETSNGRVGSTRHDHGGAADADFYINDGKTKLSFDNPEHRTILATIIEEAAARGVQGIGGDTDYMGDGRLHIGFGKSATWGGKGGKGAAPQWIRDAHARGLAKASQTGTTVVSDEAEQDTSTEQDSTSKTTAPDELADREITRNENLYTDEESSNKTESDNKVESTAEQREELPSNQIEVTDTETCLLYTSPSPRDRTRSRMPSSA